MKLEQLLDHLPPREDLVRLGRYVATMRRPSRGELLVSGFAGALVGAGIALLFAPRSGRELRREIGERVGGLLEQQGDMGNGRTGTFSQPEMR